MQNQPGLVIKTNKFPIDENEDKNNVNPGMYGLSLCCYIQDNLPKHGIKVLRFVNEDWGWWIEVKVEKFKMGLCIYSDADIGENPTIYAIISDIIDGKQWMWSKLRYIDQSSNIKLIFDLLKSLFQSDNEIEQVFECDGYPF